MRVEISVESVDGVRVAAGAGAARVELCAGLSDGGLTPSAALIEALRRAGRGARPRAAAAGQELGRF
jgi:copper homeostasis protein CutC